MKPFLLRRRENRVLGTLNFVGYGCYCVVLQSRAILHNIFIDSTVINPGVLIDIIGCQDYTRADTPE